MLKRLMKYFPNIFFDPFETGDWFLELVFVRRRGWCTLRGYFVIRFRGPKKKKHVALGVTPIVTIYRLAPFEIFTFISRKNLELSGT